MLCVSLAADGCGNGRGEHFRYYVTDAWEPFDELIAFPMALRGYRTHASLMPSYSGGS